jgi:hypothetical protein
VALTSAGETGGKVQPEVPPKYQASSHPIDNTTTDQLTHFI